MKASRSDPASSLVAVAARQADDLNRGITFQIWRSVEAWVNLGEQQLLFLEGLEDFDVVGRGAAVAVQVKATAAPITLRSDAVTALLVNYWRACRDNSGREVHYRIVTTSAIGTEQSSPLPPASGLELWKECAMRGDLEKVRRLQQFLASDGSIVGKLVDIGPQPAPDPSLLLFLQTADPSEVLARLIRRVTFQTDSEDSDLTREAVAVALRAHGEKLGVRPGECGAALDRLFRVAAETAGRKTDRMLTRDRFRREFEEATTQRLTSGEIDAIRSAGAIPIIPAGLPGSAASFGISLGTELVVQRGVPELPAATMGRKTLVRDIAAQVRQVGLTLIRGSSGMGKSTLAQLVARELGGDWMWVDFQGIPAVAIPHVTRAIGLAFAEAASPKNIVLDNLNFEPADLAGLENSLAVATRTARNRGGLVLVTTQRELPVRLQTKLAVQPADMIDVPRLNEADIREFCLLLDCPSAQVPSWAKIVALQSSGHPRLVHARLVGLKIGNWPAPQTSDVLATAPEVHEEQDLARQLLERAPPSDKELLYRLSVASGPFRRDHAVALGKLAPPISYSADAFDRLVGPWIDRLRSGYFRLSPLLHGAAQKNWPDEQVRKTRSGLARTMLKGGDKTWIEANEILFQGLIAKDEKAVTAVTVSLLTAGFDAFETFAERMDWVTLMGREDGSRVFASNPSLNFFLRLLQFRIMAIIGPLRANAICEIIDREFASTDAKWAKEFRAIWLSTALIYFQAAVPPRTLLRYWAELRTLIGTVPRLKKLARGLTEFGSGLTDSPATDVAGHLLMMILARKMNDAQLVEFADAVNELPGTTREAVLGYLPHLVFPLRLMIERVWIEEADNASPDWLRVLRNLSAFRERTTTWKLPQVSSYVARSLGAVEDEYRDNPDAAIAILDEAAGVPGGDTRLVEDQKATVLYRQKRYGEALAIWARLLPDWVLTARTADHTYFYASQRAGHCAGVLAEWPLAIEIFRRAAAMAKVAGARLLEATFLADQALAEWKNGGRVEALALLADSLTVLEILDSGEESTLEIHRAHKCIEQVAKWIRFDVGARDEDHVWEPPAGMCSRIEGDDKIKDHPTCPFDLLWFFVADTEHRANLGAAIFDRAWKRRRKSKYAAFRTFMTHLKVRIAFAKLEFSTLLQDIEDLVQAVAQSKAQLATGEPAFAPDSYGHISRSDSAAAMEDAAASALIALVATGKEPAVFLPAWQTAAKRLPDGRAIERMLQMAASVLSADEAALPQMIQGNEPELVRLIAAIRMSRESSLPIEAAIVGHALITAFVMRSQFRHDLEIRWAGLVRAEWQRRIGIPALLLTPKLTIPPIRTACHGNAIGLRLVATILLEARHATRVRFPLDIVETWHVLAEQ